jgi:hypothetical protein
MSLIIISVSQPLIFFHDSVIQHCGAMADLEDKEGEVRQRLSLNNSTY